MQEEPPAVSGTPEAQEADGEGKEAVLQRRVALLLSKATATIFDYIAQACMRWLLVSCKTGQDGGPTWAACMHAQGLFERHKLIVASQLCIAVLKRSGQLSQAKFEFLLRGPRREGVENPLKDWLSDSVWASIQALKAPPHDA